MTSKNRPWNAARLAEFADDHSIFLANRWWIEQSRRPRDKFHIWIKPGRADADGTPWTPAVAAEGSPFLDGFVKQEPALDPAESAPKAAARIAAVIRKAWGLPAAGR